jgi:hypothetical protein
VRRPWRRSARPRAAIAGWCLSLLAAPGPQRDQFYPGMKQDSSPQESRQTGLLSGRSAAVSTTRKTTAACMSIEPPDELFLSPAQVAQRWWFHVESIRRKIRRREIASVLIGRRRLVPLSELKRIEAEGRIPARAVGEKLDHASPPPSKIRS